MESNKLSKKTLLVFEDSSKWLATNAEKIVLFRLHLTYVSYAIYIPLLICIIEYSKINI